MEFRILEFPVFQSFTQNEPQSMVLKLQLSLNFGIILAYLPFADPETGRPQGQSWEI